MTKDFEVTFLIDGKNVGSSVLSVVHGVLLTEAAEDEFYAILRKNEKSLIQEAEEEEREALISHLTSKEEEKLKAKHAEDYQGTDDDMPDAFEDWLSDLPLPEIKKIIA